MSLQALFLAAKLLVMLCCCCNAVTVNNRAPFCLLIKTDATTSQVSFLFHSSDTPAPPLFYWSEWTSDDQLAGCFTSADATVVRRHFSLCRKERVWDSEQKLNRFNLTALLRDKSLCEMNSNISFALHGEDANRGQRTEKRRRKRAWVLPGTLWCGRGSSANDYGQLGMFEYADKCCREHDHCEHIIRSFTVNFGVFNPSLFTLSHCDCDHRFKQCLLNGNDTVSNMVGYSFFNVLKIRCFEFVQKRKCTQYNWFGVCTEVKLAPVALLKDSTPYNTTDLNTTTRDTIELSCNEVPVKLSRKNTKSKQIKSKKTCAPVDFTNQKTLQLSRTPESRFETTKRLQATGHEEGRKPSFMTFTVAPQKKTSRKKKMTTLQMNVNRSLSTKEKSSSLKTTHQARQRPVSASGGRTRQNTRKTQKLQIQTSRKSRKERRTLNQNNEERRERDYTQKLTE